MGYLNTEGLKRLWAKIQKLKQDKLTPDKSITITDENEIKVSLPTVYLTLPEYQKLSEEEKNSDILYITKDSPPVHDDNFHPNDYSSEETIIGTWIDGRPIYRRAFENYVSDEMRIVESESLKVIDKIITMYGVVVSTKFEQHVIPSKYVLLNYVALPVSNLYMVALDMDSSNINLYKNKQVRLIIEYTKLEEEAGDI